MSAIAIIVSVLTVMASLILGLMGLSALSKPGGDRRRAVLMLLVSVVVLLGLYLWLTSPSRTAGSASAEMVEQNARSHHIFVTALIGVGVGPYPSRGGVLERKSHV